MFKKIFLIIFVFCLAASPVAVKAIGNGNPDGNGHPNVASISFELNGEKWVYCSGVLIAPDVLLTSGLCTWLLDIDSSSAAFVAFDPVFGQDNNFIEAREWHTHPLYNQSPSNTYDLGVILLPAGSTTSRPAAQLPEIGMLDRLKTKGELLETDFTNVGYGIQPFSTGRPGGIFDGTRRIALTPFAALTSNILKLQMNSHSTGGGSVCSIDQGGPVFLPGSQGEILLAITSSFDPNCRAMSEAYRLDTFGAQAFLDKFVTLP